MSSLSTSLTILCSIMFIHKSRKTEFQANTARPPVILFHSFFVWPFQTKWDRCLILIKYLHRGWVPKFATGLKHQTGYNSKSIWVTRLLFSQNDYLMGESFWLKDSLITCIVFELCLIWYINPVANFGTHPLHILKHISAVDST